MTKVQLSFAMIGLMLTTASGCTSQDEQVSPEAAAAAVVDMAAVKADLAILAQARVFFGHQSVGRNILAGIEALAAEAGVPLRIQQIERLPPDDGPGLFHAPVGENGYPGEKCVDFRRFLAAPERPVYDVAVLKFCYVDLDVGTPLDPHGLLDEYAKMVAELREQRPDVSLLHVTIPLRADAPGKRTYVKRLLGLSTEDDAANILRNTFNEALQARFANEPIFDLAKVESTRPDGTRSSFTKNGKTYYSLVYDYSTDRGHLNEEGRRRVAAGFIHALADLLRGRGFAS